MTDLDDIARLSRRLFQLAGGRNFTIDDIMGAGAAGAMVIIDTLDEHGPVSLLDEDERDEVMEEEVIPRVLEIVDELEEEIHFHDNRTGRDYYVMCDSFSGVCLTRITGRIAEAYWLDPEDGWQCRWAEIDPAQLDLIDEDGTDFVPRPEKIAEVVAELESLELQLLAQTKPSS